MAQSNPYCQMCRKEICVVCKQKIDNCKCPCPNFVICRYCEVQEKTMPPCDDMFPPVATNGCGGGGGLMGGGPMNKMMMPLMMMMMMNANKSGGGKSCECGKRGRDRKRRDRDSSPRSDRDLPKRGHPCCCKAAAPNVQPVLQNYPQPVMKPPSACPQSCCTCSSRGDDRYDKCREPINQYFFGSDCYPQPSQQTPQFSAAAAPQPYDDYYDRAPPQQANHQKQPPRSSPRKDSSAGKLEYSHRKPLNRKDNSIVVNKV